MLWTIIFILLGFLLLIKGAQWTVSGAASLARKYRVSDLTIGLTIVAFGTSAPELVVNSIAAVDNLPDVVYGNIIGSNLFNLFVILGLAGIIYPISVKSATIWKEIPISLLAVVMLWILAYGIPHSAPELSRLEGLFLLLLFGGFLYYIFIQMKADRSALVVEEEQLHSGKMIALLIAAGLAGLIIGGKLVVDNAVSLALSLGLSQKIIGLTIIAAGTSLPELVTSVVAAARKNSDMAIGNVIGSNIFNIFLILGVSALIRPLPYNPAFNLDIFLLFGGTLLLFAAMFSGKKYILDRWESVVLLLIFLSYTVFMISFQ